MLTDKSDFSLPLLSQKHVNAEAKLMPFERNYWNIRKISRVFRFSVSFDSSHC